MTQFQNQGQVGLQYLGYGCQSEHAPTDIIRHARERLKELRAKLRQVDDWKQEADMIARMLEASGRGEEDPPA